MNDKSSVHAEREGIERFFRGEQDPEDWKELALHLRGCESCREHYLAVRETHLGEDERARPDLVLGKREIELAASHALTRFERQRARRRTSAVIGGLALAASLALLVVVRPWQSSSKPDEFGARGGGDAVGVEVLCFDKGDLARPLVLKADGSCAPGSLVKLKAVSLDARHKHVLAVVLGPDRAMMTSLRAELPSAAPVTLKGYLTLGESGSLTVLFVFSESPLDEQALADAVQGLSSKAKGAPPELDVPGGTPAQRAIVIGVRR